MAHAFTLSDSGLLSVLKKQWRTASIWRTQNSFLFSDLHASDAGRFAEACGGAGRFTELELVPHPANVQHPDTIEAEYGMENGVLKVRARAAMAGYLLRRWNVDCTEDHSLKGGEFHLWLRNRQALYGVTNLILAPGYDAQGDE